MLDKKSKGLGLKKFRDTLDKVSSATTMGERIKALRNVQRLTQAELGALVGVSAQAVCLWESDNSTSIKTDTFIRLVQVLETDYVFLCWGREVIPPLDKRTKANP